MSQYVVSFNGRPGTREKVTPGNTATGITEAIRNPSTGDFKHLLAKAALIQNQGSYDAKFCIDGTTPTAAAGTDRGLILASGDSYAMIGYESVKNFLVIDNVSGEACKVEVLCYF